MSAGSTGITGQKKALGKVAKRGVAWSFLREGVTEAILFPSSMLAARLLTPREFGITSAALFFIQLASRLSDLGFNAALVRSKGVTQAHYASVFVVNIAMGLLSFGTLVLSAPYIGAFYNTPEAGAILPVAALSFLFAPFGAVPGAILTRDMKYRQSTIVEWNFSVTFAVSSVVLAWMGYSYWSLIYSRVASVAVMTATRIYFARWKPSFRFSWAALRDVLSFGLGMHTRRLLDYTAGNFDNLVVGKVMGMHSLGLYDKAYGTIDRLLGRVNTGGPGVMFRIFSMIHEEPARFKRAYSRVIMSATVFAFPMFAVMYVTAEPIMVVLFGSAWRAAATPFQFMCLAGALKLVNAYASSATQAAGLIWAEVWRQALYIALIVAGIVALASWGPAGAAAAVLLATGAMTILMHVLLRKVAHLPWWQMIEPQVPGLLIAVVVGAVTFGAGYALRLAMPAPGDVLLLAVQGLAGVVAYGAVVLFAPLPALRRLVHEVATDSAPAAIKKQRWLQWYLRTTAGYAESTTP